MGISYFLVKRDKPEAFDIDKDYYGLTDLFPATAGKETGLLGKFPIPKLKDLPFIVGSRHRIVDSTIFRVTDYYQSAEEMITKIIDLKQRPREEYDIEMLTNMFEWAGSDPLQVIADFTYLEDRGAADEYQLCAPPNDYRLFGYSK